MKAALPLLIILAVFLLPSEVFSQTTLRERAASQAAQIKDSILDRRETIASKAADLREARLSKLESTRVKLRAKLRTFKDKTRAERVERIDDRLERINQNRTTAMIRHLDQMSALVVKVEARLPAVISAETTASVSAAIVEAKAKIDTARVAVETQAAKSYPLNVTSETKAKVEAKTVRDLLHEDLKDTHNQVVEARAAVANMVSLILSSL